MIAERAYLAGLIDGEGSICMVSRGRGARTRAVLLVVDNTDMRMLRWIRRNFGGYATPGNSRNKRWKPVGEWRVTGERAVEIIEGILPFLVTKRAQAKLALAHFKVCCRARKNGGITGVGSVGGAAYKPNVIARLSRISAKIARLNQRGARI